MKPFNLLVLFLLFSCSTARKNPTTLPTVIIPAPETKAPSEPTQTPNPGHIGEGSTYQETPKPFPSATGYFTVKINTENCSNEQNAKYKEAEKFIASYVNSNKFKEDVLNFKYDNKLQFFWNEGMTNEQIYNHIIRGAEALLPTENYQMDITAVCYYKGWPNKTIGYTYPNIIKIYANTYFHSTYSACEVANNTFHEWLHKMGFDHAVSWSKPRDSTVPYALGDLVESNCKLQSI